MNRLKKRIFQIIEPSKGNDKQSRFFDKFILILISINVLSVILESFPQIAIEYKPILNSLEIISIIIFTIEYLFRIYTSDFLYPHDNWLKSALKYFNRNKIIKIEKTNIATEIM